VSPRTTAWPRGGREVAGRLGCAGMGRAQREGDNGGRRLGVARKGWDGARFLYANLPSDAAMKMECRPSTATSTGARTAGFRRWTGGPRPAPSRYGVVRGVRTAGRTPRPRGAVHGEGARHGLGRRVARTPRPAGARARRVARECTRRRGATTFEPQKCCWLFVQN
jgi:hypothetical protein